ncbi:alpha-hydroxy acid oxidase [Streptomyces sp. NPDC051963]|uniref:alpha-hydroxy acid oxidase n=1 Tax=Streptomyces sp. NPDC051963 TaxID=3365678 RepID=UPI0037D69F5F
MVEKLTTSLAEYERRARGLLPSDLFERWFGSKGDPLWLSNTNNLDAYDRVFLRPRVLAAEPAVGLSTTVLGKRVNSPVYLAPAGAQGRFHPEAELASARAARSAGTIFALSSASTYSMEEVRAVSDGTLFFQLYVLKDRGLTADLVKRAEDAGYAAIIVTVDEPATWSNERDGASNALRESRQPKELKSHTPTTPFGNLRGTGISSEEGLLEAMEARLNWAVIDWLRERTDLPLIVKGIQVPEDARLAVEHGAQAVVVSNHGGHSMNGAYPTILSLPEIVDAVNGEAEVHLDGGIRRGTDVLKALGLGARAVAIGRGMYWGLVVGGEDGVKEVLDVLKEELYLACLFCSVTDIRAVNRALIRLPRC